MLLSDHERAIAPYHVVMPHQQMAGAEPTAFILDTNVLIEWSASTPAIPR